MGIEYKDDGTIDITRMDSGPIRRVRDPFLNPYIFGFALGLIGGLIGGCFLTLLIQNW